VCAACANKSVVTDCRLAAAAVSQFGEFGVKLARLLLSSKKRATNGNQRFGSNFFLVGTTCDTGDGGVVQYRSNF